MKLKKKTCQILVMGVRTPKLNMKDQSFEVKRFDLEDVEAFFKTICKLSDTDRVQDLGDRFIFLECFDDDYDNNFYTGWFVSARYGEITQLIDAKTLARRANTKRITEGDENRTYFVLDKSSGLFLLQSDNKRIVTGNAINKYLYSKVDQFSSYINNFNKLNRKHLHITKENFIQIDFDISSVFMDEVRRLARIKKMTIECSVHEGASNDVLDAIQQQLEGIDNYDTVEYSVAIKERGLGMKKIEDFIQTLEQTELYRNLKVGGTTSFGRPRVVSWEKHARKSEVQVLVNQNGLIGQDDILKKMIEVAKKEQSL
ncbi:hypothetical protein P4S95_23540 [Aneurinibacillus aneurinilyticus]|uniref:hypothetical protein n=1 Tax=Aneurinibacillus aneurinilyticus TaxID=1391 RepID=UPI002E1E17FC|nr:hypothetical protein [Aneurinibacillus aneurinilyticus]